MSSLIFQEFGALKNDLTWVKKTKTKKKLSNIGFVDQYFRIAAFMQNELLPSSKFGVSGV